MLCSLVIVALFSFTKCGAQSCFGDQLPSFTLSNGGFNSFRGELLLSPNLTFKCAGEVTRWQTFMERTGLYTTVAFLVLRPTSSSCGYEFVDRSIKTNVNVGASFLVDISIANPIPVLPGDVVGLHTVHATDERNRFRTYNGGYSGLTYRVDISQGDILTGNSFSCSGASQSASVPIIKVEMTVSTTPPPPPEQLTTAHHVTTELSTTTSLSVTTPPPVTTPPHVTTSRTSTTTEPEITTPPPTTAPPPVTTPPLMTTPSPVTTPPPVTTPEPPPAMPFTATQSQRFSSQTYSEISTLETWQNSSGIELTTNESTPNGTSTTNSPDDSVQDQSTNILVIVLPVAATAALLVSLLCIGFGLYVFTHKRRTYKASQQLSVLQSSSIHYQRNHEIQNRYEHVYDMVNETGVDSHGNRRGRHNEIQESSFNNPIISKTPESSMDHVTGAERRSNARNIDDYQEPLSLPEDGSIDAVSGMARNIENLAYEVPVHSPHKQGNTATTTTEQGQGLAYEVPVNSPLHVQQSNAIPDISVQRQDLAYEVPVNALRVQQPNAIPVQRQDLSYEVPVNLSPVQPNAIQDMAVQRQDLAYEVPFDSTHVQQSHNLPNRYSVPSNSHRKMKKNGVVEQMRLIKSSQPLPDKEYDIPHNSVTPTEGQKTIRSKPERNHYNSPCLPRK